MWSKKITALVSALAIVFSIIAPLAVYAEETVKPSINAVRYENGNTVVMLSNISGGEVIAVKYDRGVVAAVKRAEVTGDTATLEGIEADKVMVWNSLNGMKPICEAYSVKSDIPPLTEPISVDFTTMSEVVKYTESNGQGFVEKSGAIMPSGYERTVAPVSEIRLSTDGASVTETNGTYLHSKQNSDDGDDYNNGGLIYRIDTGKPGAYHIEVEVTGTKDDTRVAPTGMDSGKLTGTGNWDNANMVKRTVSAVWTGNKWSYDFATGEDFVEIEIEPVKLANVSAPQTVGVKRITVTPIENISADKPTIHIIGDSTQKTYTFNETISAWGQTLVNYFDTSKVNVINYSMGGRAMKSNYCEGRFDEILIKGRQGDFVFIHSAHNDETISTNRFSRGAGTKKDDLTANNASYNEWLNMYVEAVKARGMTPVLVTAMPRVNGSTGKYSESTLKPNGFNPDSPENMRKKAASDNKVGLAELYKGAKAYIDKLDGKEVAYIYNNTEAGETPANNAANGANGDGTHYKEAASKQWSRIILQSIYDQSVSDEDIYTDKDIMTELVSYMKQEVQEAAQSGDWSAVFPEMASDVSTVDIKPNAQKQAESSYYYRNNIEKALQLGLLHKDSDNLFKPMETVTVGEFARGIETAFGLGENTLSSYTKTYAELLSEHSPVSIQEVPEISSFEEGEFTVTVNQTEGGTVTVYNNSAFHSATADISADVTENAVISDNAYFTLQAPSVVVKKTDKNGVFTNKAVTTNAIEVRNDGVKQPVYTAKESGTLTMYLYFDNTKIITCENKTDGTKSEKYIEGEKASADKRANVFGEVTFNVEEGKTYEIYTNGGTGRLFGVMYASNDYPNSTSSLTVNSGDEIKVVAVPNENYINKSILVNGEIKTTSKEYVFTVTGNTTITAEFTSEPALVETTRIASDAPLTREAMGAVLYDAYLAKYGKDDDGKWNKTDYMKQNGSIPSPDDPNYDPNIQYEGSPYIPLTGWGALEDTDTLNSVLYKKVKEVYNLGLIRSETGIARGAISNGKMLEPKAEVTRAKAAKTLVFAFILTQPLNGESQTIPEGYGIKEPSEIALPNTEALTTVFN